MRVQKSRTEACEWELEKRMDKKDCVDVKWTEFSILIDMGHKGGEEKRVKNGAEVLSLENWKVNGDISGNG